MAVGGLDYRQWNDALLKRLPGDARNSRTPSPGKCFWSISMPAVAGDREDAARDKWFGNSLNWTMRVFATVSNWKRNSLNMPLRETLLRIRFDGEFAPDGYVDLTALEKEFRDRFCCSAN